MKTYERKVDGYTIRQRLSDEDARRLGLLGEKPKPEEKLPAADTKKVEPENKARGGGRGRKLKGD